MFGPSLAAALTMHLEAFELMLPGMWVMALSPAAAAAAIERALEICFDRRTRVVYTIGLLSTWYDLTVR